MYYSPTTGGFYLPTSQDRPADCIKVSEDLYQSLLEGRAAGKAIALDHQDKLVLLDPDVTAQALCRSVDAAADHARVVVAGAPLRDEEYKLAAAEALAFKTAGYPVNAVPRTVQAWAIGRTAKQAADSILAEALAYTEALYVIRETRLQAKALIRQAMLSGNVEQAQDIAAETVARISAAVAGVGNNVS